MGYDTLLERGMRLGTAWSLHAVHVALRQDLVTCQTLLYRTRRHPCNHHILTPQQCTIRENTCRKGSGGAVRSCGPTPSLSRPP